MNLLQQYFKKKTQLLILELEIEKEVNKYLTNLSDNKRTYQNNNIVLQCVISGTGDQGQDIWDIGDKEVWDDEFYFHVFEKLELNSPLYVF